MFGPHMLVIEPLGLFGRVIQNAAAFLTERDLNRRGNAFTDRNTRFDLLANGFDGAVGTQKTIGERLVFAQQPEEQMLRFNIGAAVLAGFISRKKDYAPSLFRIAFKHGSPTPFQGRRVP